MFQNKPLGDFSLEGMQLYDVHVSMASSSDDDANFDSQIYFENESILIVFKDTYLFGKGSIMHDQGTSEEFTF